ncbi:MAG: DUF6515 family protein [Candidatus Electrothrix scaldis]|nr:MAG: DUF6515 family protein [Candidatus Electrothrix sp. GW3-3]
MLQRRQSFEQKRGQERKKTLRTVRICWAVFLSTGLLFTPLTPVFARGFNPVVPGYASPDRGAPVVPRMSQPTRPSRSPDRGYRNRPSSSNRSRNHRSGNYVAPSRRGSFYPSRRSYSAPRHYNRSRRRFSRGSVYATLPLGYAAIMLANDLYYYYSGSFYRPAPGGYMIVDAPVGAVVPSLPFGYSYLVVNGTRYYTYEGNYYLQVSNGYQIVQDPRRRVVQPVLSNQIVVTSNMLNVRSGPGIQYSISGRVYSGDVLQVLQREAGWTYVRLPDNTWGWVMSQFTAPVGVRADG